MECRREHSRNVVHLVNGTHMPKPTITGAYPHYPVMEPKPIKATGIWAFAQGVRKQVMGTQHRRIADVRALADRVGAVSINGIAYRLVWDFDHKVHDEDGRPVMGVCEHDPHEPGQVMISIDAAAGSERQDVERSTTLHELGHALFDMPAAVYADADALSHLPANRFSACFGLDRAP